MSVKTSVSEAEALTKWCPFARIGAYTDRGHMMAITVNRDPRLEVSESCLCIGHRCMAWRYVETHVPDSAGDFVKADDAYGYCGLAGDPR